MDNNMLNLFNSLISNPETMKNLKDVIDSSTNNKQNDDTKEQFYDNMPSQATSNDLSFLNDFLNQSQNSELLRRINKAYSVYSDKSTPGVRLLEALGPYLSNKRAINLEKVKNVIRMTNAFSEFNKK